MKGAQILKGKKQTNSVGVMIFYIKYEFTGKKERKTSKTDNCVAKVLIQARLV